MKKFSLGTLGNSLVGIIWGALGGQLLGMMGLGRAEVVEASSSMDLSSILGSVTRGGVGGVVLAIVGMIKNAMSK